MIACLLSTSGASLPSALFDLLLHYSPRIEREGEVVYLEFGKVERAHHLWRSGKGAFALGVASSHFVARVAAQQGGWRVVYPGEEAAFLEELSIGYLPAEEETLRRLRLVGIEKMGQLVALGCDRLSDPFGEEGRLLWELAQGVEERPFVPDSLPFYLEEEFAWCGLGDERLVEGVVRLFERLQRLSLVALCLRLVVECEDGTCRSVDVRYGRPIGDGRRALSLVQIRLGALSLPAQPCGLTVTIVEAIEREALQLSLFEQPSKREQIDPLIQRMRQRSNPAALMQLVWDEPRSRLPDRCAHLESLLRPAFCRPLLAPRPLQARSGSQGEPTQVAWRGKWRPVAALFERWEVEEGWWSRDSVHRTYYRAQIGEAVVRLFCDRKRDRWYVH